MFRFAISAAAGFASIFALSIHLNKELGPVDLALVSPGIDPIITTSISPVAMENNAASIGTEAAPQLGLYLLTRNDASTVCVFERGLELQNGSAAMEVGEDCAEIYPALINVQFWKTLPKGDVAFTDKSGKTILQFAQTETADFVSIQPSALQLSLQQL